MATPDTTAKVDDRVKCELCGEHTHSIAYHLKQKHPEVTLEEYQKKYPDSPVLSETAKERLAQEKARLAKKDERDKKSDAIVGIDKRAFHETFGIPVDVPGALNAKKQPIMISVLSECEDPDMIAEMDENYVFEVDILKNAILGIELNIPTYIWGHAGTGKSTFVEQISARTRRPMMRVQHTVNTEESHIVGQWTVRAGETKFELGPLATAMKRGWLYLADEYDFALPSVLSVYQPVLEGKPLVIKEADAENRIIKPHPNFRFMATGNTNGSGDDTGLYQGTSIQNEANYDRFGVTLEMKYMKPELESTMIAAQAGILPDDARRLVEFGQLIREAYEGAKISKPISPRALINAALLGQRRYSWSVGINLAFSNKLNRVDRQVADSCAQRVFGA